MNGMIAQFLRDAYLEENCEFLDYTTTLVMSNGSGVRQR